MEKFGMAKHTEFIIPGIGNIWWSPRSHNPNPINGKYKKIREYPRPSRSDGERLLFPVMHYMAVLSHENNEESMEE